MQRINSGLMAIAALSAVSMAASPAIPDHIPEPGSARNRPSGNTPVPGGGAKEREKRKRQRHRALWKAWDAIRDQDYLTDEEAIRICAAKAGVPYEDAFEIMNPNQ